MINKRFKLLYNHLSWPFYHHCKPTKVVHIFLIIYMCHFVNVFSLKKTIHFIAIAARIEGKLVQDWKNIDF